MAKFRNIISKVGKPANLREAMDEIRAERGRGARKWLADKFGVKPDTAGRWLSGKQRPGGRASTRKAREMEQRITRSVNRPRAAARHIREAQTIHVGKIHLKASSKSGPRNVGDLRVTPDMRAQLDRVADLIEAGDLDAADRAMQGVILTGWFRTANVGRRKADQDMGVDSYDDMFDLS